MVHEMSRGSHTIIVDKSNLVVAHEPVWVSITGISAVSSCSGRCGIHSMKWLASSRLGIAAGNMSVLHDLDEQRHY